MVEQSRKPLPTPLAMSVAPAKPTDSPIPVSPKSLPESGRSSTRPHPHFGFPTPKIRLKVNDLSHAGALIFFSSTNPVNVLSDSVIQVLQTLYVPEESDKRIPPTRSVTLILRKMPGVAYTTGTDLDNDHKEIHFSLDYIARIPSDPPMRRREEIAGVLVHEMVHCYQWNGLGTAPGGLIEGIADFVRLRVGLNPPHWKKESGGDWDAGYQHTGYFLDWLESRYGEGSVHKINEALKSKKYEEEEFWKGLFGTGIGELWKEYTAHIGNRDESTEKPMVALDGVGEEEEEAEEEGVMVERDGESTHRPNHEKANGDPPSYLI
ncbi:hypothetical protein MMC06_002940 [Schaereria dolodes]|nr:hypothetical protein [Schaereria dolodes]